MVVRALAAALAVFALAGPAHAADPLQDGQWGLEMINAPGAWPTSTGVGAVVAVIDTGVQRDHPDLGGRLLDGHDFVGDDPIESGDEDGDPEDGNGHGTHVTGIVAANRNNGEGIVGVAPGARVLPLRVLDDDGAGYADDTIKAIDMAIDSGVHVINLSLGDFVPLQSTLFEDPDYEAVLKRAVAAGIVVVIAAGNNGLPKCENPNVDGIVCVGAVDEMGERAVYSSHGANVDLMAPGGSGPGGTDMDILSSWNDGDYYGVSGTSQATPHVAGVAALLVSLGLGGQEAVDRMVATADRTGSLIGETRLVDAAAAVEGLAPPPPGGNEPDDPADPAAGSFSTKRKLRLRAVRRRGFRVRCMAARPGPCRVVVRHRGRRIARAREDVPAEIATRVTASLNRAGRRRMKRVRRRARVKLRVALPGERARAVRVRIRR